MKTTTRIQSLKTPDLAGGVILAAELAQEISQSLAAVRQSIPKPGGTNYALPAHIPDELIASILLVAVSIANDGWSKPDLEESSLLHAL
ncbi:hypothetical protein OAG63_00810 [Methylacidiphilales bacterium]|nr:hypothetical protein [Candidatus Methylacidiphilales bacterium]